MLAFWITAAALLLLGYAFFIPALLGKTRAERLSRARLNLALHRQRQEELAREAAGPEELARLAAESERNLLGDLEAAPAPQAAPAAGSGRALLLYALASLPIFAFSVYLALGRPDLVDLPPQAPAAKMADVEDSIRKLAERLKEKPDDLEGWVLLGRSLQATRQPAQAVTAYEYALKLDPENLDLQGLLAEALAEAHQGATEGRPAEIVADILRKDPNHKGALWLAGVAAAERKDIPKAVEHWTRLQAQFPKESEEARQIGQYIAEVQGAASAAPAPSSQAQAQAQPGKRLRVKVDLAESLKARAAPEDALFVFAKAAEGPPMPLAVVKKQVKDLPLEVDLDDTLAMVPGMNLSAFERVVIGARVSKRGQPIPAPGDLQGLTAPLAAENGGRYAVTVDQVVGGP
jgi:cytochrome c-type biogenesis protein CcmH